MTPVSIRRMLAGLVVSAACLATLAGPGAESAFARCAGPDIEGQGTPNQSSEQKVWNPLFETSANPLSCSLGSPPPTVVYNPHGEVKAYESWNVDVNSTTVEFGDTNAFIGVELAPTAAQESNEILAAGPAGAKVLTIPVAQSAIAIVVHLPVGCTNVSGGPVSGRLAIKDAVLEKVFRGVDTKWSQLLNGATLAGGGGCSATSKITRAVFQEGASTTALFMRWLDVIHQQPVEGPDTWNDLGQPTNNTLWPNESAHPVIRGVGGAGVLQQVAANPGTIGYAPLLQARQNSAFVPTGGGAGTPTFWTEVQDGANKYADPSTNGDDNTVANANCEGTHYTDGGTTTAQPPSTEDVWSQVTTAKAQKNYDLCNPTYDLALINYQGFPGVVNALPEEETIKNYCEYMLSDGVAGGQPEILDHDDLGDSISSTPSRNVLKIAQEGCAKL